MFCASALSEHLDTEAAVEDVLTAVVDAMCEGGLQREANVVWVFFSGHHRTRAGYILSRVSETLAEAVVVGCSASGVTSGTLEVEEAPGLTMFAAHMPGVTAKGFFFEPDDAPTSGEQWRALACDDNGEVPVAICLLTDPFTVNADAAVESLHSGMPGVTLFGAIAGGARLPGDTRLLCGEHRLDRGVVGLSLFGNLAVDTVVAQGARPIGVPMFVTSGRGNLIYEIDGQPAMTAVQNMFSTLDPGEQALFRNGVLLGVAMAPGGERYDWGDFLVRDVVGYDPSQRSALTVGATVATGDVIQFHVRDASSAADDLVHGLSDHRREQPEACGALMLTCVGRGQGLYQRVGHDSAVFAATMGDVPIAGFFGNGEIGEVHHVPYLHGFTAVFAFFRPQLPVI